ncbi:DNA internalization-related competence protein ComEC/Rec2 [Haloechinothrix sp. LS1_15]|uniref:DNA internalization-related competence protein ComEC/Rec2 n=1 Tax=Haloechinothrix sp. LS1_15 TaxID=2652248 RepID=UPI0029468D11|nr:DNA internalization-related competence protein ComEC/Rec2 [Haloechinothrix sp. LS1_15]MDV6012059.1 DNA internalization-related competence protein ComEC/Rec2 [Haloechinothrix sp. LS1_15]
MIGDPAAIDERPRQDYRLVPAAATLWCAAWSGLLASWWLSLVVGFTAAAAAVLVLIRRPRGRAAGAAAALLLAAGLAVGPVGVQLSAAQHDPLRAHAQQHAPVQAQVTIRERPEPVRAGAAGATTRGQPRVVAVAEVRAAVAGGRRVTSSGRVRLVAPERHWSWLLPGQRLTVTGTLAPARGDALTVATIRVAHDTAPAHTTAPRWWQRLGRQLRQGLRQAATVLPEEQAGLLAGLVVGDTSGMPPSLLDDFRSAGMAHLVAVSGLHVGVVCGAVILVLRLLRIGPRLTAVLAGTALAGYVITVGYAPSVLRAGLMGAVGLLALLLGRQRSAMPALAFATGALVTVDPAMATRFGFAMSVSATAALVLLAPAWTDRLRSTGVPAGPAAALVVPFAAFLATAPLIAVMVGEISLVTVAANLVAAPVVAVTTVLGALAAALSPLGSWPAELSARLTWPGTSWLVWVANRAAAVPGGVLDWPDGWSGGMSAALAMGLLGAACHLRSLRRILVFAALAGTVAMLVARLLTPGWPPDGWVLVACDVGQGDGLVLATGQPGEAVVLDTGPGGGAMADCLTRLRVERIPLLLITHLHEDHFGGLPAVLRGTDVDAVAMGPGRTPGWAWEAVTGAAGQAGVPVHQLAAGDRLRWEELDLRLLGPRHVPAEQPEDPSGTEINDLSLVASASTPLGRILLTGDAELAAQADLLASEVDLRAEVLKVPHHGSAATHAEFLDAVAPEVAVVSSGHGNPYGHPDGEVLDHLTEAGARVARTDEHGDIALLPAGPQGGTRDQSPPQVVPSSGNVPSTR